MTPYKRVPMRDIIGGHRPLQVKEFGKKIHENLVKEDRQKRAERERSGKISGGKLGKPTLWAVLDLIGVPDEFDPYVLGKFKRGNDVEDRAIQFLIGVDPKKHKPGDRVKSKKTAPLKGEFTLQLEMGYRGGTGFIDLAQHTLEADIYHEIKSATKLAFDKVSASGNSAKIKQGNSYVVGKAEPNYHHCLQLAYYCLGGGVSRAFLHYFNADDYRLTSFFIDPMNYKEEIDKEIDDIESVFLTKKLPAFEGFLPYHKLKRYWSYKEWNELEPDQMMAKLKREFPEQYKKFMEMKI